MALAEFIDREVDRIENDMFKLAHITLMGERGKDLSSFLVAAGRYQQLKAERDRWLERKKKREEPESYMEEMPEPEPTKQSAPPRPRRARPWGGT
jgi:hypothetical protein